MVISSVITGRGVRGFTIPRTADAEIFGNNTTLPSGCTKNLTRSPGCSPRCSRMDFGIVACPLTVIADSILLSPLLIMECNTTLLSARQAMRFGHVDSANSSQWVDAVHRAAGHLRSPLAKSSPVFARGKPSYLGCKGSTLCAAPRLAPYPGQYHRARAAVCLNWSRLFSDRIYNTFTFF
jgi:hypothetical protein